MKAGITAILILLVAFKGFSQDTIVKCDKQIIVCKILSIATSSVTYSLPDDKKGRTHTESKSNLQYIRYADGPKLYCITNILETQCECKKHRLTFTLNVLPLVINEESIYIDYCYKEKHSFGISIGQIYANPRFYVNILSIDQGTNPGTVWNGIVTRIDYKYHFPNNKQLYMGVDLLYKSLSYSNMSFLNSNDGGRATNTFIRNENATVNGIDWLVGRHFSSIEKIVDIEMFWSIGYRYRVRNYTTISSTINGFAGPQPLGSYTLYQKYPMFTIGLNMGFNTFYK